MRVQGNFNGKFSVKNQFEITNGHLSKIAVFNVEAIREYQLISVTDEPMSSINVHRKHSYKTNGRNKLIKHAKKLGFSLNEIKKLLVYWHK